MKINQIISQLSQYDGDTEVLLNDEFMGNLFQLDSFELVQTYDNNFILLNIDYGEYDNGQEQKSSMVDTGL